MFIDIFKRHTRKNEGTTGEIVADAEKRLVYAEVYAPDRPDCDGEYMTAPEIEKMAHKFAKELKLAQVDQEHQNVVTEGVSIVETFIARKGDPDFLEGSWVVCVHVDDDDTWDKVKKGEINGFSMEAMVVKETKEVEMEIPPVITGLTTKSEEHTHHFYVSYDDSGKFQGGVTDMVDGHQHVIRRGTLTEQALKGDVLHAHKFSSVDTIKILS